MSYLGDFTPGKTVEVPFNTHTTGGVPTTLAGSPAVAVYKGTSTTPITAGVSAVSVDFDTTTGSHLVTIDTSADAAYTGGAEYKVRLTSGTVGGQSVAGTWLAIFSLNNRSALRPTTADRTLDVSATGEAGIDLDNVGSQTATLNLSGTTIADVTTKTGFSLATAPPTAAAIAAAVMAIFGGESFTVASSGSTSSEIRTNRTEASNAWNNAAVIVEVGGVTYVRRCSTYSNTNGAITVDVALPAAPDADSTGYLIGRIV